MPRTPIHSFVAASGLILVTAFAISGQQTEQAEDQIPTIVIAPKKSGKPKVVAIRRINLLLRDPGPDGITDDDRKPYVEIELYVGYPDLGTNLAHLVQIGDRQIGVHFFSPSGEDHHAVLRLEPQDFEALTDGSEIVYRVGNPVDPEEYKRLYDEGKTAQLQGLKVGKLDKKMIDLEPTVEKRAGWQPPK